LKRVRGNILAERGEDRKKIGKKKLGGLERLVFGESRRRREK
jgi:hypothetical protein